VGGGGRPWGGTPPKKLARRVVTWGKNRLVKLKVWGVSQQINETKGRLKTYEEKKKIARKEGAGDGLRKPYQPGKFGD